MKTIALSIAAAAAVIAAPASAESIKVQHSDLNLASSDGQRILNGRIRAAAREVCGVSVAHKMGPGKAADALRCAREARAKATQSLASISYKATTAG